MLVIACERRPRSNEDKYSRNCDFTRNRLHGREVARHDVAVLVEDDVAVLVALLEDVPVDLDVAGGRPKLGIADERLGDMANGVLGQHDVAVDVDDDVTGRALDAGVERVRLALMTVLDQFDATVERPDLDGLPRRLNPLAVGSAVRLHVAVDVVLDAVGCVIGAAVVDDDDLEHVHGIVLRLDRVEAAVDDLGLVVRGHDDRDRRQLEVLDGVVVGDLEVLVATDPISR